MSKSNHFIGQPILKQLLFHLDKEEILKISRENGGEKYIKRFDAWQHLCIMLYAVISRFDSLREIVSRCGEKNLACFAKRARMGLTLCIRCVSSHMWMRRNNRISRLDTSMERVPMPLKFRYGRNVIVQGGSQGGALAIVAAGLDGRGTQCLANHPAPSDMAAYSVGQTGGYPHLNRIEGILTPENIKTLAYFDVVNFARHVNADTFMTWGYNDDTCPPTTSYAVWNTLDCNKDRILTPINEHWVSENLRGTKLQWMLRHLK